MKESDLFEPAKEFLLNKTNCEAVYAEVIDMDVVGIHGNTCIGIEMKTSLNFKVIEQAERRKHLVDYMFILVPKPKQYHSQMIMDWIKSLGIGLMYYDERNSHESKISIYFWGKRFKGTRRYKITEFVDKKLDSINVGGVKGGESITPYKNTIDKIKHVLYFTKEGLTINELLDRVQTHYSSPKPSVVATLKAHWNQEWCEIEIRGKERYFKMKEDYRETYWNEYKELRSEIQALRNGR